MSGPCVPKRDCYFDAQQYWHGNRAGFRYGNKGKTDDELRLIALLDWQRHVDRGVIPPKCETCGLHHKALEAKV